MESFRGRVKELDLAPKLSELSDDEVLQLLAQNVASGAYRFWESPALPMVGQEASVPYVAPPQQAEPSPEPSEPQAQPPPVAQADAFREAAKTGAPFCEV